MGSTAGARVVHGRVTGTAADIVVAMDFTPAKVEVYNVTGLVTLKWFKGMAAANGLKAITDGTISLITTLGITVQESLSAGSRGFTIGADTDVNVADEVIYYVATE